MNDQGEASLINEEEQKRRALELVLDAWDQALAEGVSADIIATTAIFASITDMVDVYGEEPVAQMTEDLPVRIRRGEFTLKGTEQ